MTRPIPMRWEGDCFKPINGYWAGECDREFVVGEISPIVIYEDRSSISHSHQFAWLKQAWLSLPENLAPLYPSPEYLRKRALIDAGFYDETVVDAGSNAAAIRVASVFRSKDDFAHVVVQGPFVAIRTAKSQSRRAMDRETFQKSKQAILDIVAAMIGVEPEKLLAQKETA